MSGTAIGLIVAACVFAGGVAGTLLDRVLPPEHLSRETRDVVMLGTGMLSVLASLVLGLLIATAKSSYDTKDTNMRSFATDIISLDETLRQYGDGALAARRALRDYATTFSGTFGLKSLQALTWLVTPKPSLFSSARRRKFEPSGSRMTTSGGLWTRLSPPARRSCASGGFYWRKAAQACVRRSLSFWFAGSPPFSSASHARPRIRLSIRRSCFARSPWAPRFF